MTYFQLQGRPCKKKWHGSPTGTFLHPNGNYRGKSKSVYHIAKRIAQVKFLNYFNTRY